MANAFPPSELLAPMVSPSLYCTLALNSLPSTAFSLASKPYAGLVSMASFNFG